ncbi:Lsr2 family protein [Nonomuraea turkmeniaca]|uniref:Lsr2 family protein n=1 Tax=Nonomuraea turkmeniaca TaxID=103838 RepID=A0A5S4FP58_9ACTN|nr:Lsr2 family protein [Nonomuraea turkmeniaca]TMR22475.1 Lsr2 family protein [Nonomuraea turkmeniaca]
MAKQIREILIDDIDGGEADETVSFAIDGATYEIDLASDKAKKLREVLTPFVKHARRSSGVQIRRRRTGTTAVSRQRSREIRDWAKEHNIPVSERGRIAATVVEQFEAASK